MCTLSVTAAFRGVVAVDGPSHATADPEAALAVLTQGSGDYSVVGELVGACAAGASAVLAFISQHNKHQWGVGEGA